MSRFFWSFSLSSFKFWLKSSVLGVVSFSSGMFKPSKIYWVLAEWLAADFLFQA
jgi:hypothetical protein